MLTVLTIVCAFGTRYAVRLMTALILIATAGLIVSMIVMLFKSHSSFISTIDASAGHGAYAKTVDAGVKAGLSPDHGGYSTRSTFGACFYGMAVLIYAFWGTYLSAEFKGAGQRRRQLISMNGAGFTCLIGLLAIIFLFLHTIGYNFFVSALAGNYTGPGSGTIGVASYVYFSAHRRELTPAGDHHRSVLRRMVPAGGVHQPLDATTRADDLVIRRSAAAQAERGQREDPHSDHRDHRHLGRVHSDRRVPRVHVEVLRGGGRQYRVLVLLDRARRNIDRPHQMAPARPVQRVPGRMAARRYRGAPDRRCAAAPRWARWECSSGFYFHTELGIVYFHGMIVASIGVFVLALVWWLIAGGVRRRQGLDLSAAYRSIPPE